MPKAKITFNIAEHTCEKINQWAMRFYADPKHWAAYEEWHLKEYGCPPENADEWKSIHANERKEEDR